MTALGHEQAVAYAATGLFRGASIELGPDALEHIYRQYIAPRAARRQVAAGLVRFFGRKHAVTLSPEGRSV